MFFFFFNYFNIDSLSKIADRYVFLIIEEQTSQSIFKKVIIATNPMEAE